MFMYELIFIAICIICMCNIVVKILETIHDIKGDDEDDTPDIFNK